MPVSSRISATDSVSAQLLETEEQLAHMRQERELAEESWRAERAELQAAVRARDEFIAIAAHELRNPMAAVLLHVQGMRLTSERHGSVPDLPKRLGMLEQRIKAFINRATMFLDVTRLSAGAYRLESESVVLDEAVKAAIEDFKIQAEQAGCALETDLQDGIVGQWDRLAVTQIASNLLSNAIKFGIARPIQIRIWADESDAFLRVADRGMGMALADQQRVFAKFERAVRRQQHGGFGLGLWIVRQLIERMAGDIAFSSVPGEGSTFTVRLPLGRPGAPEGT